MTPDLVRSPELMAFLQEIERERRAYPVGEEERWKDLPTPQKEWYFEDHVFYAMVEMQRRWYSTYADHPYQEDLRRKLRATATTGPPLDRLLGDEPTDFEERCLLHIVGTRADRWSRLCERVGLAEIPDRFRIYRAVRDPHTVGAVVRS